MAKGSARRVVSNILLVVGIVLIAVAGYLWWTKQSTYRQQDDVNAALAEYAEVENTTVEEGNRGPVVDWDGLKAINDEVVGWLQIPGTVINYPVYQHSDNDYYLTYDAYGRTGAYGQVFVDYENSAPGMVDSQTLLYGHHLLNGEMFQAVADMDSQENFDAVETVWYVTEDTTYELVPLFLYYTTAEDTTVREFSFASQDEFHEYLRDKLSLAVVSRADASSSIDGLTHVLTLSTCNYYDGYGRTELVCAMRSEVEG